MSKKDIPTITFPTSDFEEVAKMSNRAVVRIFRQHIWHVRQRLRNQVNLPEDHDAYAIKRTTEGVSVLIMMNGAEVFRCVFVPPREY